MPILSVDHLVTKQMLDLYAAIRTSEGKHGWEGVKVTNPPDKGTQHDKLARLIDLKESIPTYSTTVVKPWIEFMIYLADVEDKEAKYYYNFLTSWLTKRDSLVARTCEGIRGFIVQQICKHPGGETALRNRITELMDSVNDLKNELALEQQNPHKDKSKSTIDKLKEKIEITTKRHNALNEALNNADLYVKQYFTKVIQRDKRTDKDGKLCFNYSSFDKFYDDVAKGKRTATLLDALEKTGLQPPHAVAAQSVAPQTVAPQPVAPQPAVVRPTIFKPIKPSVPVYVVPTAIEEESDTQTDTQEMDTQADSSKNDDDSNSYSYDSNRDKSDSDDDDYQPTTMKRKA